MSSISIAWNSFESCFVTRAKSTFSFERIYSHPVDKDTGLICDQTIKLTVPATSKKYLDKLRRVKYRDSETDKVLVFLTNNFDLPAKAIVDLYKQRWQVELFFKWIKAEPANQKLLRHVRECSEDPDMDCRERLPHGCHYQEKAENRGWPLHNSTDFERASF